MPDSHWVWNCKSLSFSLYFSLSPFIISLLYLSPYFSCLLSPSLFLSSLSSFSLLLPINTCIHNPSLSSKLVNYSLLIFHATSWQCVTPSRISSTLSLMTGFPLFIFPLRYKTHLCVILSPSRGKKVQRACVSHPWQRLQPTSQSGKLMAFQATQWSYYDEDEEREERITPPLGREWWYGVTWLFTPQKQDKILISSRCLVSSALPSLGDCASTIAAPQVSVEKRDVCLLPFRNHRPL